MKYIFPFIFGASFGIFLIHIGVDSLSLNYYIASIFLSAAFIYGTFNQ